MPTTHNPIVRRSAGVARPFAPLAALALAGLCGCVGTRNNSAGDPFQAIDPGRGLRIIEVNLVGVELGIGVVIKTDNGSVRSQFVARSTDGGATRILGLELELWIDTDDNGVRDHNERASILERSEPNGTPNLHLPFEVPFENGRPLRFVATIETTVGTKVVPGDFALP